MIHQCDVRHLCTTTHFTLAHTCNANPCPRTSTSCPIPTSSRPPIHAATPLLCLPDQEEIVGAMQTSMSPQSFFTARLCPSLLVMSLSSSLPILSCRHPEIGRLLRETRGSARNGPVLLKGVPEHSAASANLDNFGESPTGSWAQFLQTSSRRKEEYEEGRGVRIFALYTQCLSWRSKVTHIEVW